MSYSFNRKKKLKLTKIIANSYASVHFTIMIYTKYILLILQTAYVERKKIITFYLFANDFRMQEILHLPNCSKYMIKVL